MRLFMGVLTCALLLFCGCSNREIMEVRQMAINDVDITKISDGNYRGSFTYGKFTYEVETTVKDGQIRSINILSNRTTKPAKMAEGVIPRVIQQQKINVDAVSGATTTSKALLKAIENSLKQ